MARIVSELIYKLIADEKDLVAGLKSAEKKTEELGKKLEGVGKKLTLGLTAPIVAAGAAAVKLASDVGEAFNAANVVFQDSTGIIEEWGKNAVEQAGLTRAEFFQASAVIGAGLINAGESADVAARQTIELTKRAADLASIFNTDVNDALLALQSGLRGESEPLRRFAVNLNEAAVAAKAVELGLADSEKEVSDYAKSQARLAVILEQTQRFQGDFVNTSDQLANSTRILKAQIKESAAELGQELLPVVLDIVTKARELVSGFSNLDENGKKLVITLAAIAASLGPIITLAGKLLQGGPIALGFAALAATAATFALNLSNAQAEFKQLKTLLEGGTTGNAGKDLEIINREIGKMRAQIGGSTGLFPDEDAQLQKELDKLIATRNTLVDKARWSAQNQKGQEAIAAAAEREATASAAVEASQARQDAINERYKKNRDEVLSILESEKTEYQKIEEQILRLQSTPWATGQLENDRLRAIENLRARQKEITDAEIQEAINAELEKEQAFADAEARKRDAYLKFLEEKDAADKKANEAELARIEAEKQARIEAQKFILGQLFSLNKQLLQNDIDRINQSQLSEEEKAEEIAKIKRKQALADRAQALVDIATNTAVAITKALPNVILASIIGGLGAAQAAAVLAQPIPSFAEGTRNFMVPPGFPNDSFPILVQSGERVTVETPQQQSGGSGDGVTFQIGTVIADPAGLRDLDRLLKKYGTVESLRRG
ncbi:MAG: phage tail tape measure protein [Alphaproteobacteria bacterium]|nr:phage tail tape measure protein [Alphaproteobacteria bacterium]